MPLQFDADSQEQSWHGQLQLLQSTGWPQQPNTKLSHSEKPDEPHPLKTPKHRGNSVSDCLEVI